MARRIIAAAPVATVGSPNPAAGRLTGVTVGVVVATCAVAVGLGDLVLDTWQVALWLFLVSLHLDSLPIWIHEYVAPIVLHSLSWLHLLLHSNLADTVGVGDPLGLSEQSFLSGAFTFLQVLVAL